MGNWFDAKGRGLIFGKLFLWDNYRFFFICFMWFQVYGHAINMWVILQRLFFLVWFWLMDMIGDGALWSQPCSMVCGPSITYISFQIHLKIYCKRIFFTFIRKITYWWCWYFCACRKKDADATTTNSGKPINNEPQPIGFFEAFALPNVLSYSLAFGFFKLVSPLSLKNNPLSNLYICR